MARLSEMYRIIGNYLEQHGDKEVTSISACNGSAPNAYNLHLHDVYEGRPEDKPYTARHNLYIPE